jgi:hypothetical protein
MGVGYCVSPLHRITHFDTSAVTTRPPVRGSDSPIDQVAEAMGANVGVEPPRLFSPTMEEILAWRQGIATKYRDQLEEQLTWEEDTTFEVSEEVATSGDVMFRYVAAVLDQRGTSELNKLMDNTEPPGHEYKAVFAEADRRGSVVEVYSNAIEAGEPETLPSESYGLIGIASTFLSIDPFLYAFVNNTRSSQKIINPKTMISGT